MLAQLVMDWHAAGTKGHGGCHVGESFTKYSRGKYSLSPYNTLQPNEALSTCTRSRLHPQKSEGRERGEEKPCKLSSDLISALAASLLLQCELSALSDSSSSYGS
jgi:hypothetical protein